MKKIMFNDKYGLTEAVLSGRKTMTRRIIPPIEIDWARRGKVTLPVSGYRHRALWMDCRQFLPDSSPFDYVAPQKYQSAYDFDEEVAVAQSYSNLREVLAKRDFKRTDALYDRFYRAMQMGEAHDGMPGWNNKMFVNAEYMPHRIRITDIKAERLQDISEEDAMREGIFKYDKPPLHHEGDHFAPWPPYVKPYKYDYDNLKYRCSARYAFAYLIDKVSGTGTWNSNPWVFAYTFELLY